MKKDYAPARCIFYPIFSKFRILLLLIIIFSYLFYNDKQHVNVTKLSGLFYMYLL
jgi:hypothetical protein